MTKLPIPGVTYDIFITAFMKDSVQAFIKKNELRQGQAFFNFLNTYNHDLANKIRGTEFDPYYSEDVTPTVHNYIVENWTIN